MVKKTTKTPVVKAPVVEEVQETTPATPIQVMQLGDLEKLKQSYVKNGGLDANHRVDVLNGIKTYFKDDPNASQVLGIPQEVVDKINGIAAIGFVAALGDEIVMGPSSWATKMRMTQIEAINAVNSATGISIDVKALPEPDADGKIQVTKENIKVSKETKKQIENEKKVAEKPLEDPTKIETDEQLKAALEFQLVNPKVNKPVDKLVTTANFYRSYLCILANRSDNKEAELEKVKKLTLSDLLQDIITMVQPTFVTSGFGKYLCGLVALTKSVVPAFCMFKRAAAKATTYKFSDEEIAAIVRILVVWSNSAQIADISRDVKVLSKDAAKNADAIKDNTNKIAYLQAVIEIVMSPSYDLADQFIIAYNNDDNAMHDSAVKVCKSVMDTYYANVEIPELESDSALVNVQQHIGIINNLFNDVYLRRDEYSTDKLFEIGTATEETPQEEGKN